MISTDPFDDQTYKEVKRRWDLVAKPLGSLGLLEDMTARIGAVQGCADLDISKRAVIAMCADNGIVAEGISQSGQDVTAAVASWMGRDESSVCKMASGFGIDVIPVDVGINMEGSPEGVVCRKVMKGTRDFAKEPAMTEDECMQAVDAGIDMVGECSLKGYKLLAAGEMGIGNTTTSAALAAALLGLDAEEMTGRGAGLSDSGLEKRLDVIKRAKLLSGRFRKRIFIRTFGSFDVFLDGRPVYFRAAKAKELLALMVDKRGAILTSQEALSRIWEGRSYDSNSASVYRVNMKKLKDILKEEGLEEILVDDNKRGKYLDTTKFDCDLYDFLDGDRKAINSFSGEYMSEYSWAEPRTGYLQAIKEEYAKERAAGGSS